MGCPYPFILVFQKIRHYGPHIYSIAVFHVFRLFEILTNIRRAHDVVIFQFFFTAPKPLRISGLPGTRSDVGPVWGSCNHQCSR